MRNCPRQGCKVRPLLRSMERANLGIAEIFRQEPALGVSLMFQSLRQRKSSRSLRILFITVIFCLAMALHGTCIREWSSIQRVPSKKRRYPRPSVTMTNPVFKPSRARQRRGASGPGKLSVLHEQSDAKSAWQRWGMIACQKRLETSPPTVVPKYGTVPHTLVPSPCRSDWNLAQDPPIDYLAYQPAAEPDWEHPQSATFSFLTFPVGTTLTACCARDPTHGLQLI